MTMSKLRHIPFGYKIENGEIVIETTESIAVEYIFNKYLNGESYSQIAKQIIIPYKENTILWNKNMVKRILENNKYIGNSNYPIIISPELLKQVTEIKSQKYTRKNIEVTPAIKTIQSKTICCECGTKIARHWTGKKKWRKIIWHCTNKECENSIRLSDEIIETSIITALNIVIAEPSNVDLPSTPTHEHSLTVSKLTNEINRELEKIDIDQDRLKALIMQCAIAKYENCSEPKHYLTESIKLELEKSCPLNEVDITLFEKIVKNILIDKDGTINIKLINEKVLKGA